MGGQTVRAGQSVWDGQTGCERLTESAAAGLSVQWRAAQSGKHALGWER